MRRMEFAEGAPFGEAEDFTHARVAFIGADAKKKLFSGQNAIGESIRVDGISYQIVGILKHVINNSDDNLNEHIYVPFSAMSDLKDTYLPELDCHGIRRRQRQSGKGAAELHGLPSQLRSQRRAGRLCV